MVSEQTRKDVLNCEMTPETTKLFSDYSRSKRSYLKDKTVELFGGQNMVICLSERSIEELTQDLNCMVDALKYNMFCQKVLGNEVVNYELKFSHEDGKLIVSQSVEAIKPAAS